LPGRSDHRSTRKRGDFSPDVATLRPMRGAFDRARRSVATAVIAAAIAASVGCQPPAAGAATADEPGRKPARSGVKMTEGKLPGIDSSELTARERSEWWTHVSELLAPCEDQPVSVAQCVQESRACAACAPAAEFLLRQVTLGKTSAQVEAAFQLRFDPDAKRTVSVDGAPFKGPKDAPVTIVEWADFQCPFCALAAPFLDYVTKAYPNQVKVVFRNFPISHHPYAVQAAEAGVAAYRQGKFWAMHDRIFANREALDDAIFIRLAKEIGLDTDRFQADMAAQATLDFIERDRQEADELGLRGTPMIYVNGRNFNLQHFDLFQDLLPWIETEIAVTTGQHVKPSVPPPRLAEMPGSPAAAGAGH
jgi:protein-disulfide isomerase